MSGDPPRSPEAAAPVELGRLLREPRRFSFFQAVRLLESTRSGAAPLGYNGPAGEESIRFRPNPSLAFPSADVEGIEELHPEGENAPSHRMTVNFLGLYGSTSPLPAFYTEEILAADDEESSRRDFLDVFHHRLISLFYRSWEKYRYFAQYRPGAADRFSRWMCAFLGLGHDALRDGLALDPRRLLAYAGLFSMRSRSAAVTRRIISHYFDGLPVEIEQCVERRVRIEERQRSRLGVGCCTLGRDCTIGERVRDISGKFRIRVGPLDFEGFKSYLPPGECFQPLRDLVRFTLKDPLEFDVSVELMQEEIPRLKLAGDNPCRLGWSTWLGMAPARDVSVTLGA